MWADYLLGQRSFDSEEYSGRKLQEFLREAFESESSTTTRLPRN